MIFPDWGESARTTSAGAELPLYTEWAVDWDAGALALRDGEPYTVSGTEALKTWVRLALTPDNARFLYSAHSHDYGNELLEVLGETGGILESRVRQYIREALLISPYITGVDGFSFARSGSLLEADFSVHTVYEDFSFGIEVETT